MTVALSAWKTEVAKVSALRQTGGAADLAGTRADTRTVPAAFVLLLDETSARNTTGSSITSQMVAQTVGVVIAVSNARDRSGDAAVADLETLRESIMGVLHGVKLTGSHSPVEHVQGAVQEWNETTLWWMDQFRTSFLRRN